jgi:hypothetical protein
MKKKIFNIFLFISFCFTAALAGADESWQLLENVNDLVGRWEGNVTMNIPENPAEMIPKSSMDVRAIFEYSKNTRARNTDYSFFMNIDFEKFLNDFMKFPELKVLGVSKDDIWDMFSIIFSSMDELSDYNVVVKKYYFEFNYNGIIDELLNDSEQGQIFLNKAKNQMKWLFNSAVSLNLGDEGFMELILYKTDK